MLKNTKGIIYVLLSGFLWGLMSIFVNKLKSIGLESMNIITVRVWISSVAILIMMLFKDKKSLKIRLKDMWCFIGTGIISLTMFNFFYFSNITETSPGIAAVLMYTSPVFVMIMSVIFFKEKLTATKILACILTFFGCALVSGVSGDMISGKGLFFGIMSGIGYALYSIFGRFATDKGYSSLTVTAYTFFFACIGTAPFSDYKKILTSISDENFFGIAFIVICAVMFTVVPYLLYTKGLSYIETGKAGVIAAFEVVVAAVVGFLIFDESFDAIKILGIFLVLFSLYVMNIKKRINIKNEGDERL